MARPKKVQRPVEISISIPEELNLKMRLELWSEVEGRVPHGAISSFVAGLVQEHFNKLEAGQ